MADGWLFVPLKAWSSVIIGAWRTLTEIGRGGLGGGGGGGAAVFLLDFGDARDGDCSWPLGETVINGSISTEKNSFLRQGLCLRKKYLWSELIEMSEDHWWYLLSWYLWLNQNLYWNHCYCRFDQILLLWWIQVLQVQFYDSRKVNIQSSPQIRENKVTYFEVLWRRCQWWNGVLWRYFICVSSSWCICMFNGFLVDWS